MQQLSVRKIRFQHIRSFHITAQSHNQFLPYPFIRIELEGTSLYLHFIPVFLSIIRIFVNSCGESY